MKTLNIYVLKGFLLTFGMAIGILTFGMMGARMVKIFDYVSQGVPLGNFFLFVLYIMPIVLTFTVPWAILVAIMLVFGRLSADSEITAMRACGVSILQVVSPIMIIATLMTAVCLYLQVNVGPPLLGASRQLMKKTVIDSPTAIFAPGKPVRYENNIIYIDDKKNDILQDIQIFTMSGNNKVSKDITANKGKLVLDKKAKTLSILLYDCMVIDKTSEPEIRAYSERMKFTFNYGKEFNKFEVGKRAKYMTLKELLGRMKIEKKLNRNTCDLEVELNQRIAFALSPIAFMLLGLPLAIRTSRRETSVGLFLSVILAGLFFLSIILCESLESHPGLYPQYLLWIPNLLYQVVGASMIFKIAKH
ncbi:MAG: YjgP/YjgQ family permease [Lentisphaerae bacterium]|nr:YjgP/YjgQ family permease [Lentisphaerota bacterium]MCP4103473.1 YjgP/YjgQ family permease [Lentisphaerota bacterium]